MMEEKRWCRNNILKTLRTSFKIICDFYVRVCTNNNTPHLGKYFFFLKSVFFLPVVPDLQEATVGWGKSIQVSMLSVQMASLYVPYIKYRYISSQFSQSHTRICSFIETEWRRGYIQIMVFERKKQSDTRSLHQNSSMSKWQLHAASLDCTVIFGYLFLSRVQIMCVSWQIAGCQLCLCGRLVGLVAEIKN